MSTSHAHPRRLHATSSTLQLHSSWVHEQEGGLNEQALSNLVYAYGKAGLLDRCLLQWVFNVGAIRLDYVDLGRGAFNFKPQVGGLACGWLLPQAVYAFIDCLTGCHGLS